MSMKKIEPIFIEKSLGLLDTPEGVAQVEANATLMLILAYYLFAEEQWNTLLKLLNKT